MENKECIICAFKDRQEDIIETPEGFCHRECLDDQDQIYYKLKDRDNKNEDSNLEREN